jgi:hypothetical protein
MVQTMSDIETKVKHSKRRHKSIAHVVYEQKNGIKHSHHSDNPRKVVKEKTIQEKRFDEVKDD